MAYFTASVDPVDTNKQFAKELGVDYPILSDPEMRVASAYGVLIPGIGVAKRWTFYLGKDGKILYIDQNVNVNTAGADVAARLGTLGVAKKKTASIR